jgi:hypothetical protein
MDTPSFPILEKKGDAHEEAHGDPTEQLSQPIQQ